MANQNLELALKIRADLAQAQREVEALRLRSPGLKQPLKVPTAVCVLLQLAMLCWERQRHLICSKHHNQPAISALKSPG